MRGEVLILVNIRNSHFLLSLTHSALCLVVFQSNTCFGPKPQYLIQSHPFYIFRNKSIRFSFLVLRCQEIVSLSVFEMGKENVDVFLSIRQICWNTIFAFLKFKLFCKGFVNDLHQWKECLILSIWMRLFLQSWMLDGMIQRIFLKRFIIFESRWYAESKCEAYKQYSKYCSLVNHIP